jgi:hypothetical protein
MGGGAGMTGRAFPWHWRVAEPLGEAAAIVLLIPLLLAVAIWNGFPIIFYDTGAYILQGLGGAFVEERSPVYSLFLPATGAFLSLWLTVIAQAAVTGFVMTETARALAPRMTLPVLLGIGFVLVVVTGLPWYVGQVEPDCFTALVALSFYLLAFHARTLGRGRCLALFLIASFAIAAHPSHLVLAAGFILVTGLYWAMKRWSPGAAAWPTIQPQRLILSVALGIVLVVASNFAFTREIFISRAGPVFVFARLVQDGIVMRLLEDTCPQSGYRLCAYKDDMPRTADQWLWDSDTPFKKLKGFEGTTAESERIIFDSLRRYPLMHLRTAIDDSARQFGEFRTGDQLEPQEWVLFPDFERFIPRQVPAYMAARQQKGLFDFRLVNRIDVSAGWFSIVVLAGAFLVTLARRRRDEALFLGFVLVALLGNAAVCGALSNPHDRYQSRMIWLAPFALALAATGWKPQMTKRPYGVAKHWPEIPDEILLAPMSEEDLRWAEGYYNDENGITKPEFWTTPDPDALKAWHKRWPANPTVTRKK